MSARYARQAIRLSWTFTGQVLQIIRVHLLGGHRHVGCRGSIEVIVVVPSSKERWNMMWSHLWMCMAGIGLVVWDTGDERENEKGSSAPRIVASEEFPRIAMLWSPAQNLGGARTQRLAKYGVSVVGVEALGLRWERAEHPDLAETLEPATINKARATLAEVFTTNPRAVVCCELYFFEADQGSYPEDHPWWFRDQKGQKVSFWRGSYNMNVGDENYIEHIARRIIAVYDAVDGKAGIFLDNLRFDRTAKRGWTKLLERLRAARPDIVVLVNSGWSSTDLEWIAPQINGIMYEDSVAHTDDNDTEAFYRRTVEHWNRLRAPRISINEKFGARDDTASMMRELTRTLVYTDNYFIYTDSTYGHRHSWRREWDAPLGRAIEPIRTPTSGQLARRGFEGGTVVWLPETAPAPVTIVLDALHVSTSAGAPARGFTIEPGTGLVLVRMP
jgi:hypothetical protein